MYQCWYKYYLYKNKVISYIIIQLSMNCKLLFNIDTFLCYITYLSYLKIKYYIYKQYIFSILILINNLIIYLYI